MINNYFKVNILPNTMIYLGELYDVTPVDGKAEKELRVNGYTIYKEDDRLVKIILDCDFHPNCRADTKEFCISSSLIGQLVNMDLISLINSSISVYNMDTAFERPWGKIEYKKLNTMKVKWRTG